MQSLRTRISCCVTAESGRPHSIVTSFCVLRHKCFVFPHSSFSPPFHHTTSCPTKHRADATGSTRRSSDRKRASYDPRHGWKNALDCRGTNVERVWGSPWDVERAPRKWDGGVRNEQRKVDATHDVGFKLSTIYTYTFQYLLYLHNETFKKMVK